ncbi:MAG: tRNA-splicing endonuclease subunit sen54 [Claussenomyces sp. TS43310]|nr:MAG: tRNA-splicing endonuclease subunit sen54 [Claussenomyces sp. TS43310]
MVSGVEDEDAPLSHLQAHARAHDEADQDPSDETQDFRFLSALTAGGAGAKIPKRGEKDFEPHGTRHQDEVLEASRQAMHAALSHARVHAPKSDHVRAWFLGDGVFEEEGEDDDDGMGERALAMSEESRGRGLSRDHVVMVETVKGVAYRTVGKTSLGTVDPKLWLLPEEALYLVERGGMDLWWPRRPNAAMKGHVQPAHTTEEDLEDDDGLPLSLQAAYALLVGEVGQPGRVSLDVFTVYANLRRSGYAVLRAPDDETTLDSSSQRGVSNRATTASSKNLFSRLFAHYFTASSVEHAPSGPLVRPGLYRSYNTVYQQVSLIPRHQPSAHPAAAAAAAPNDPFKVVFHVWKPTRIPTFAKSNPGDADYRVAVVSARSDAVPSLAQLTALLESTPWDPPRPEWAGPEKSYQRLKHGWRNVVVAVVDQGIISYLRVAEGAFGEERLHERFDRNGVGRGGKRGGGGGRGRGGGRGGKGRGRGH